MGAALDLSLDRVGGYDLLTNWWTSKLGGVLMSTHLVAYFSLEIHSQGCAFQFGPRLLGFDMGVWRFILLQPA